MENSGVYCFEHWSTWLAPMTKTYGRPSGVSLNTRSGRVNPGETLSRTDAGRSKGQGAAVYRMPAVFSWEVDHPGIQESSSRRCRWAGSPPGGNPPNG